MVVFWRVCRLTAGIFCRCLNFNRYFVLNVERPPTMGRTKKNKEKQREISSQMRDRLHQVHHTLYFKGKVLFLNPELVFSSNEDILPLFHKMRLFSSEPRTCKFVDKLRYVAKFAKCVKFPY